MGQRGGGWCYLGMPCNVHIVSRCHTRVFNLVEEQVSGFINFSLSLSTGPSMTRFRASLATCLVESGLEIIPGVCPPEAAAYRTFILELFCSSGTKVALRQCLLKRLPNGDWRRRDKVELYITPGVEFNAETLQQQTITALLLCLGGKNFKTYLRYRWLGCEVATDMVGLALAVHGLAAAAYTHMYLPKGRSLSGPDIDDDVRMEAVTQGDLDVLQGEEQELQQRPAQAPASDQGAASHTAGETEVATVNALSQGLSAEDQARVNAHRK